jgi:hypothetical protein
MNKKNQVEKRTRQININLTETEFTMLQVIRNAKNKSISELVRDSIYFYYATK